MTSELLTLPWREQAKRLADELVAAGKLRSPQWRAAVEQVPRHLFTPDVLDRKPDGTWHHLDATTDDGRRAWLDRVYSNTVLLTATDTTGRHALRSSSSMPGLMIRMLDTLDVQDGHRVLEIGTGTGYNAGLLTHRLGEANVFSIDIEPDLVDLARHRLTHLGYHPTLRAGDGAQGLPEYAPFDRIIATCAVPSIPRAWLEQTQPGAVILTDLKIGPGAGNLIRLTRTTDGAEGHFDPVYAAFMDIRHSPAGDDQPRRRPAKDRTTPPRHRTTSIDPKTPWTCLVVWFLAVLRIGPGATLGYSRPDASGRPTATSITAADGSWTEITLDRHADQHDVTEGGPRSIWQIIESTHLTWTDLGQPGWERLGLTVRSDQQTVWLDEPSSPRRWALADLSQER